MYESLNFDLRSEVTNLKVLEEYEAAVKAARPKPQSTVLASNASIAAIASEGCLYVLSGLVGLTLSNIPSNSATFEMLIRLEGSIYPLGAVRTLLPKL